MVRMVRKQIYIEPDEDERLRRLSSLLGISQAELIRIAIRSYGNRGKWSAARQHLSHESWLKALAIMKKRPAVDHQESPRRQTREEMYDEILSERGKPVS